MKKMWMALSVLLLAGVAQAQSMGSLQVNGQAGRFQIFQKVKAVRCDTNQRGSCDAPIYFALNQVQAVPAGSYIVGFENSINPGLVTVSAGRTAQLYLEKITVPSSVRGGKIRVYRDMSSAVEQRKILQSMFTMKRHFFRVDSSNFGDLYLAGAWERDFVQRFTYEACGSISGYYNAASDAKSVCAAWNQAKQPGDLSALYSFSSDGTLKENWVMYPGDIFPSKHPRYLVSAPMTEQDFVSVFAGAYKIQAEGKGSATVSVRVGNAN